MQELRGKVAVITGGSSGIGRALADRAAEEGMRIVLAALSQDALDTAERELQASGADVMAVRCDVSKAEAVDDLAKRTLDRFGAVHMLFNNAGVGGTTRIWEQPLEDWEWILGVNVMGVVHGIRTFVPIMLAQNEPAHIVNTSSTAGLVSGVGRGAYKVSKHAVVTLTETLAAELAEMNAPIKASVLCPAYVQSRIADAGRNRPGGASARGTSTVTPAVREAIANGMTAKAAADITFDGVRAGKLYILTHPESYARIIQRMQAILQDMDPPGVLPGIGPWEIIPNGA